jgi:NADH-quinone oxidoreductase subunit G
MYSWVRNNEILRQTPRYNPEVNDYWMCDKGRLETFKHVNNPGRIKTPMLKKEGKFVEVGWDEAIAKAASELKTFKKSEIALIGSAYDTNEDNYLLQKFATEVLGTRHIDFMRHVTEGDEDVILVRADKTPNAVGAEKVGMRPRENGLNFSGIVKAIKEGSIKALFVVDDNIASDPRVADALHRLEFLVVNFSFENETTRLADVLFPSSTFAEKNGTFTNFEGRVQRIRPSIATLDQDRALDGFAMSRLDKFGSQFDRWAKGTKRDARPTWRIVTAIASLMGAKYKYNTAEDVFNEIVSRVDDFKGMTYMKIGKKGMMLKHKEPVAVIA